MAIPINPATLYINGVIINNYLNSFMIKYLPEYMFQETSGYRDEHQNKHVGGVEDSAHLYNLAKDGNLIKISTNEVISEAEGKKIFDEYFVPNWEGYVEFEPDSENEQWHIHVNIDRGVSHYTKWAWNSACSCNFSIILLPSSSVPSRIFSI